MEHPMKLPRFSLRDLFWLVLVAAMGLGWWVDRSYYTAYQPLEVLKEYGNIERQLRELGYTMFNDESDAHGFKILPLPKP